MHNVRKGAQVFTHSVILSVTMLLAVSLLRSDPDVTSGTPDNNTVAFPDAMKIYDSRGEKIDPHADVSRLLRKFIIASTSNA